LKADIQGNGTLAALMAAGNIGQVVAYYNAPADPAFYVWRTSVSRSEMHSAYVWTEMDGFNNVAKQFQFRLLIDEGQINPSLANVRTGLQDIFTGAGFAGTRAAMIALCSRTALNVEKLFATGGTGADAANSATMGREGTLSQADIEYAMAS